MEELNRLVRPCRQLRRAKGHSVEAIEARKALGGRSRKHALGKLELWRYFDGCGEEGGRVEVASVGSSHEDGEGNDLGEHV